MIEFPDQQVFALLNSLTAQVDVEQLLNEPRALSCDNIRNGGFAQLVQPSDCAHQLAVAFCVSLVLLFI
jgi:hypothetical protein